MIQVYSADVRNSNTVYAVFLCVCECVEKCIDSNILDVVGKQSDNHFLPSFYAGFRAPNITDMANRLLATNRRKCVESLLLKLKASNIC